MRSGSLYCASIRRWNKSRSSRASSLAKTCVLRFNVSWKAWAANRPPRHRPGRRNPKSWGRSGGWTIRRLERRPRRRRTFYLTVSEPVRNSPASGRTPIASRPFALRAISSAKICAPRWRGCWRASATKRLQSGWSISATALGWGLAATPEHGNRFVNRAVCGLEAERRRPLIRRRDSMRASAPRHQRDEPVSPLEPSAREIVHRREPPATRSHGAHRPRVGHPAEMFQDESRRLGIDRISCRRETGEWNSRRRREMLSRRGESREMRIGRSASAIAVTKLIRR
jgi:hypothetical protein